VIATEAGDIPNLIEDGKTGFVVRRDYGSALAERMARLITDSNLCADMGRAARAKAEREFGMDRLVTETFEVYRSSGWEDRA
jgi:glycosyltransferase involved in cell wall biosynthesis